MVAKYDPEDLAFEWFHDPEAAKYKVGTTYAHAACYDKSRYEYMLDGDPICGIPWTEDGDYHLTKRPRNPCPACLAKMNQMRAGGGSQR